MNARFLALRQLLRTSLAALAMAWLAAGFAQPAGAQGSLPAKYRVAVAVLQGPPVAQDGSALTIEQVAALPAQSFVPALPATAYAVTANAPLWLRLRLTDADFANGAQPVLEFPTIIVDRYEVYQRAPVALGGQSPEAPRATGAWQMAAAGDFVAHTQWPMNSLRPSFPLLAPAQFEAGGHEVFVRVVHRLPVTLQPVIVQASAAVQSDAEQLLWVGLLAGVIGTLVLFCAQMSLAYRDATYAWYAGYLIFTLLAALCYSGVAQRDLWPHATEAANRAIVLAVMGAFAFNVQFSRAMFGSYQSVRWLWASRVVIASCMVYAAMTFLFDDYEKAVPMFHIASAAVVAYTWAAAFQTWRRGVRFAGYWLLVYVPYLIGIGFTLLASTGVVAVPWLPLQTPMACALVEVVAMMLCINAYSRLRHAEAVRLQTAAEHDPLTGFLNQRTFAKRAARGWVKAKAAQRDVAVMYVSVHTGGAGTGHAGELAASVPTEAMLVRSVRLLRTVATEFDLVGRLGPNMLGICMADVAQGEAPTARASRLVALGLMQSAPDQGHAALQFTVAVGQRRFFDGDFSELDAALRDLVQSREPVHRAVRFLDPVIAVRRFGMDEAQIIQK